MNSIKLIVFDVDGTLTIGEGPTEIDVVRALSVIEKSGVNICIASGKDWRYLLGFVRGVGLDKPIIIAENGGVIIHKDQIIIAKEDKILCDLVVRIKDLFPKVDFQPNKSNVSVCIDNDNNLLLEVYNFVCDYLKPYSDYSAHMQKSSIDILPVSRNKANAIKHVQNLLGCGIDETICAGDGENDRSMLSCTNNMLIVGEGLIDVVNAKRFKNTVDMLEYIITVINLGRN